MLLHSPICTQGQTPKLKSFWSGQHCITRVINQINFVLRDVKTYKQQIAHYDCIKPYATPHQRLRKRRSNNLSSKKTLQPVPVDDNDIVFVDLTDSDVPTQHAAQAPRDTASSSITLPSNF